MACDLLSKVPQPANLLSPLMDLLKVVFPAEEEWVREVTEVISNIREPVEVCWGRGGGGNMFTFQQQDLQSAALRLGHM